MVFVYYFEVKILKYITFLTYSKQRLLIFQKLKKKWNFLQKNEIS